MPPHPTMWGLGKRILKVYRLHRTLLASSDSTKGQVTEGSLSTFAVSLVVRRLSCVALLSAVTLREKKLQICAG